MKILKSLITKSTHSEILWTLLDRIILRGARFADLQRMDWQNRKKHEAFLATLFRDLTVMNGPFKGLVYAQAESICSTLLPKLLGSYERELHDVLTRFMANKYQIIVDIGCAEGFYAVGLAMRFPDTPVYAFDVDPNAIQLCKGMALRNNVAAQIHVREFCRPGDLQHLAQERRALVVCDCEGYESELFDVETVKSLSYSDVIIELHEFAVDGVTNRLKNIFLETHTIETIAATADSVKARLWKYPEISERRDKDKEFVMAEKRPSGMEWLVLTAKQTLTNNHDKL